MEINVLTRDEILNRTEPLIFEDGIAVGTSQVDFHSFTKPGASGLQQRVEPYNIPFGCLTVKGFPNLLTAGKFTSTDQVVHSSCRMTPTCCATGQAAGTAAALAREHPVDALRNIPITTLPAILSANVAAAILAKRIRPYVKPKPGIHHSEFADR